MDRFKLDNYFNLSFFPAWKCNSNSFLGLTCTEVCLEKVLHTDPSGHCNPWVRARGQEERTVVWYTSPWQLSTRGSQYAFRSLERENFMHLSSKPEHIVRKKTKTKLKEWVRWFRCCGRKRQMEQMPWSKHGLLYIKLPICQKPPSI